MSRHRVASILILPLSEATSFEENTANNNAISTLGFAYTVHYSKMSYMFITKLNKL